MMWWKEEWILEKEAKEVTVGSRWCNRERWKWKVRARTRVWTSRKAVKEMERCAFYPLRLSMGAFGMHWSQNKGNMYFYPTHFRRCLSWKDRVGVAVYLYTCESRRAQKTEGQRDCAWFSSVCIRDDPNLPIRCNPTTACTLFPLTYHTYTHTHSTNHLNSCGKIEEDLKQCSLFPFRLSEILSSVLFFFKHVTHIFICKMSGLRLRLLIWHISGRVGFNKWVKLLFSAGQIWEHCT